MWTLNEGVDLCGRLNRRLVTAGYSVALAGSVLFTGKSTKDLDLVIFPLTSNSLNLDAVRTTLTEFGLRLYVTMEKVHERWRELGSEDTKHVEVWRLGRRRIDLFFLK